MLNNNLITRPATPVQLIKPPPTPGDEIFKRAYDPEHKDLFKRPTRNDVKSSGQPPVIDGDVEQIVIDADKLPDKKKPAEAKHEKITSFSSLLKRLKVLPKQPIKNPLSTSPTSPKSKISKKEAARRRKKKIKSLQRKAKRRLKKCWRVIVRFLTSVLAIITRSLYILHALLTVWRVTVLIGQWFWVITGWLGFMILECLVVQFRRGGKEWKWIQPCILIYLMVELPSILLLEVINVHDLQIQRNISNPILGDILSEHRAEFGSNVEDVQVAGVTIASDTWNLLLEQSMLVLIIIARWLMPKGDMTGEQLSGLLLFYLGTASDIVDFFSVISEDEELVVQNYTFLFLVLITWSWSMFQFVFLVTMTHGTDDDAADSAEKKDDDESDDEADKEAMKKKKEQEEKNLLTHLSKDPHEDDDDDEKNMTVLEKIEKNVQLFLGSEVWAILVSVIFQDLPYACVRVICVFYYNIRTYTNYFFTFKNIMILILQIYRLLAVYQEHRKQIKEEKLKKKKARQLAWQTAIEAAKKGVLSKVRKGLLGKAKNLADDKAKLAKPVGSSRKLSGILRSRKVVSKKSSKLKRMSSLSNVSTLNIPYDFNVTCDEESVSKKVNEPVKSTKSLTVSTGFVNSILSSSSHNSSNYCANRTDSDSDCDNFMQKTTEKLKVTCVANVDHKVQDSQFSDCCSDSKYSTMKPESTVIEIDATICPQVFADSKSGDITEISIV